MCLHGCQVPDVWTVSGETSYGKDKNMSDAQKTANCSFLCITHISEINARFCKRLLIAFVLIVTCICSYLVEFDVFSFSGRAFIYLHTLCVRAVKTSLTALMRCIVCAFASRLCDTQIVIIVTNIQAAVAK